MSIERLLLAAAGLAGGTVVFDLVNGHPPFTWLLSLGNPPPPGSPTPGGGTAWPAPPRSSPGSSNPPAQQAPPGSSPPPSPEAPVQIVIEAWADKFQYVKGEVINLAGFVWSWDGANAQRLPGRVVHIVDPDVNGGTPWLEAVTDEDGSWGVDYQSHDEAPWRSYAVDVASGARTGILDFQPLCFDPNTGAWQPCGRYFDPSTGTWRGGT